MNGEKEERILGEHKRKETFGEGEKNEKKKVKFFKKIKKCGWFSIFMEVQ